MSFVVLGVISTVVLTSSLWAVFTYANSPKRAHVIFTEAENKLVRRIQ